MEKSFGDASMTNNTGSITEEGPALSDVEEDPSPQPGDFQQDTTIKLALSSATVKDCDNTEDVLVYEEEDSTNVSDVDSNILASTPDNDCEAHPEANTNNEVVEDGSKNVLTACQSLTATQGASDDASVSEPTATQGTSDDASVSEPTATQGASDEPSISEPDCVVQDGEQDTESVNCEETSNNVTEGEKSAATNTVADSIYLDSDPLVQKHPPPVEKRPRRLTMAQRAAMEALASFGGCDLSSVPVKKVDLRFELEADKKALKRELDNGDETDGQLPTAKKPRTRLQAANLESEKLFKDISLTDGVKTYSTVQKMKASASGTADVKVKGHVTHVERALKETLETFGGSSLDSLPVKAPSVAKEDTISANPERRLTRVERARLEVLKSFGGSDLEELMESSKEPPTENISDKENISSDTGTTV